MLLSRPLRQTGPAAMKMRFSNSIRARIDSLTPREREVMAFV